MDELQQIQDDEYSFPYHYVSQFHHGFTQNYYDSWGINYCATIEFLLEKLKSKNFNTLIDIGCGDGRLVKEIQSIYKSKEILGVDYSLKAITLAKAMNPFGHYKQLDIIHQTDEKRYDIATLMEVFEHIDPSVSEQFVDAIARLLNPLGELWVTVPHINKPIEYKHYRHFSSQSLIRSFERNFNVLEIIPFEKGRIRKRVIDYLLGNRFYILNSNRLRSILYSYYKNNLFVSSESKCNRLFVKFMLK